MSIYFIERVKYMKLTKIHTAGSDYLICTEPCQDSSALAMQLLNRRVGIGADGLIMLSEERRVELFLPDGKEGLFSSTALIAAAKYIYDTHGGESRVNLSFKDAVYSVRLSTMRGRVLCAWLDMPRIIPRPMEQLKYYHGIRGEVLRACIVHPKVSVYELCGDHAVFFMESCAALRALNIQSVCRRLEEVLFYGENIDLHFMAVAGDNALALRSWRCRIGEMSALGEGAVLSAYAATEYEIVDSHRIMVKSLNGSFCVELYGNEASLCAKCETVFVGEAV